MVELRFCPECGNTHSLLHWTFCPSCGYPLGVVIVTKIGNARDSTFNGDG